MHKLYISWLRNDRKVQLFREVIWVRCHLNNSQSLNVYDYENLYFINLWVDFHI